MADLLQIDVARNKSGKLDGLRSRSRGGRGSVKLRVPDKLRTGKIFFRAAAGSFFSPLVSRTILL